MTYENITEAKAKIHEINEQLARLSTKIQTTEQIPPLIQKSLDEDIDQILLLCVQLLRITKRL